MKKKMLIALLCISLGGGASFAMPQVKAAGTEAVQTVETEIEEGKSTNAAVESADVITLRVKKNSDITDALKAAVKEVESSGTKKIITISIPAGEYKLSDAVKLTNNVRILADKVTVTASSSGMASMLRTVQTDKVSNVTIEGGTWDCNGKVKNGFAFYAANNVTVKNCTVKKGTDHGIRTGNSTITVENSTISSFGKSGIYADAGTKIKSIRKCTITSNVSTGITLNGAHAKKIVSSTFSRNKNHGIAEYDSARIDSIYGCTIKENQGHGIYVADKSSAVIQGGTKVQRNKDNGISVSGTRSKATINGAVVTKNRGAGIVFSNCGGGKVVDAKVTYNKSHGITVSNSVVDMQCDKNAANVVEYNDWSGVSITGKSSKVTITYGDFSNNGLKPKASSEGESGHGVGVFSGAELILNNAVVEKNSVCGVSPFGAGTSATVKGCTIQSNGRHGIGGRKSVTLRIKNNVIKNNKYHGIMVNDRTNAKYIESNKISGSGQCGICVGVSSKAVIKKNTITKSKDQGIYVYGNSTADIQSCTINENKEAGIQVKTWAVVSNILDNKLDGNGNFGIYCTESTVNNMQNNTVTNHNRYGIGLLSGSICRNIKKNTLSNPSASEEIAVLGSESNVQAVRGITVKTPKKNSTKVSGTAMAGAKVSVKIAGKTYRATANASGVYTIKTSKLKKGTTLKVTATVTGGNVVYTSKKI